MVVSFPCKTCCKPVAKNHDSIQCDKCDTWAQRNCNKINKQAYRLLQKKKTNSHWFCIICTKDFLPFSDLKELQNRIWRIVFLVWLSLVCLSKVYDSFILERSISISISTVLLLWRYELRKIRTSFKHLFQRKRQYGGWKNLTVAKNS